MTIQKPEKRVKDLEAALRRTIDGAKRSHITLLHVVGRQVRKSELEITQALLLVRNREDFVGYGTGRNVHTIEFRPIDKAAIWQACWATTGAACTRHWADQRSAA